MCIHMQDMKWLRPNQEPGGLFTDKNDANANDKTQRTIHFHLASMPNEIIT